MTLSLVDVEHVCGSNGPAPGTFKVQRRSWRFEYHAGRSSHGGFWHMKKMMYQILGGMKSSYFNTIDACNDLLLQLLTRCAKLDGVHV